MSLGKFVQWMIVLAVKIILNNTLFQEGKNITTGRALTRPGNRKFSKSYSSQSTPRNDLDFLCNHCYDTTSSLSMILVLLLLFLTSLWEHNCILGVLQHEKFWSKLFCFKQITLFGDVGNWCLFRQSLPWTSSDCQLLSQLSLFQMNTKVILMPFQTAQEIKTM